MNSLRLRKYATSYLFLIPSFAFIAAFLYYPVLLAFFHSFTKWNLVETQWVGFANFKQIFTDPMFHKGLRNQAIYTATDIVKAVAFPLLAAELIHLLRGAAAKYIFRTGFILPMLMPGIVTVLLWLNMYDPTGGLINQLLGKLGLGSWAMPWLGDQRTALGALVMFGFPFISGLQFLIFYAAIGNFNHEQIEAARMDGATGWQLFMKLHLPFLKPQFKLVIILSIIGSLQDFVKILVMTGGGPGTATINPSLLMYNEAFGASRYGYGSAIGVVLFVIIIMLTIFNMKFLKSDD